MIPLGTSLFGGTHRKQLMSHTNLPGKFRCAPKAELHSPVEVLRELVKHYEVFITTAAMEYPTSFTAKYEWITEHFPLFPDSHIVFCGDKSIIAADYLMDDNAHHLCSGVRIPSPGDIKHRAPARTAVCWREDKEPSLSSASEGVSRSGSPRIGERQRSQPAFLFQASTCLSP